MKRLFFLVIFTFILLAAGCARGGGGLADDPVVARANGVDIYASDVRIHLGHAEDMLAWEFFFLFNSFELDPTAPHPQHITFGHAIRREAVRTAVFYNTFMRMAEEHGVELSDFEQMMIDHEIETIRETFGTERFYELLAEDGFRDEAHLRGLVAGQFVLDNLLTVLLDNPAYFARFEAYIEVIPELYGAKHILAHFDYFDTEDEAREYAEALLERALAGEDFDTLVIMYGFDPGMDTFPNGYSFAANDMAPEFEYTTRALGMGEISGLVRTDFGYHIIMRVEPTEADWFLLHRRTPPSPEERRIDAIFTGMQTIVDNADIEWLDALDDL